MGTKEERYDLFDLDRSFIMSLFQGFSTTLPRDMRLTLARTEVDALQFVMVIRPRLTSFLHRQIFSLRHPAVSMAARQYYMELRAHAQEKQPCDESTQEHVSGIDSVADGAASAMEIKSSRASSSHFLQNIKPITLGQLRRNKWDMVGACHDVLLRNSQLRRVVSSAIAMSQVVNDVICRYWERMTVPPTDMDTDLSFNRGRRSTLSQGNPEGNPSLFATHMTAQQYVYLHLRIAGILLPPAAIEENLLDSIILDLRTDATLSEKPTELSFVKALRMGGYRENGDVQMDDVLEASPMRRGQGEAANVDIMKTAELASSKLSSAVKDNAKSFTDLPNISFGQFWESMLELSDNWTSSAHPMEHAIFLLELYCEVFAHEWDDEEVTLLKAVRATVSESLAFQRDDLFSLMDYEEGSMGVMSEFAHLMWSIVDGPMQGVSNQSSDATSTRDSRSPKNVCNNSLSFKDAVVTPSMHDSLTPTSSAAGLETQGSGRLSKRKSRKDPLLKGSSSSSLRHRHGTSVGDKKSEEGEIAAERGKRRHRRRYHDVAEVGEERKRERERGREREREESEEESEEGAPGEEGRHRRRRHDAHGKREEWEWEEEEEDKGGKRGKRAGRDGDRRRHMEGGMSGGHKRQGYRGVKGDKEDLFQHSYSDSNDLNNSSNARSSQLSQSSRFYRRGRHGAIPNAAGRRRTDRYNDKTKRHISGMQSGDKRRYKVNEEEYLSYSDGSSAYSTTDSQLTPLSLAKRRQERMESLGRRSTEKERRRQGQGRAVLSKEEIAAKRQAVLKALRMKGIVIAADVLTDDDIINLSEEFIDADLLQRLMAGSGHAAEDLKESDFLHILLGDQEAGPVGVDDTTRMSIFAALRNQRQRGPPETAYARRRREQLEALERQRFEEEMAAAREKKREERLQQRQRLTSLKSPVVDTVVSSTNFELPPVVEPLPSAGANNLRAGRKLLKLPRLSESDTDTVAGLWLPATPPLARRLQMGGLPSHPRVVDMGDAPLSIGSQFFTDQLPEKIVGLHEHSPELLELFYHKISIDRPIKGRARLAPLMSIIGGTYHQLPVVQLQDWKRQERQNRIERSLSPQPPVQYRCAPVKLFSLTTKTSYAEALRENLQRYVDDKAYLKALYESYLK